MNTAALFRKQLQDPRFLCWRIWLLASLLSHFLVGPCWACDSLESSSWSGFVKAIQARENSSGGALCAFTIEGDGCPASFEEGGYEITGFSTTVFCDDFNGGPGSRSCIIDCEHAHLAVSGTFTFFSFTITGGKHPFFEVNAGGELFADRVTFRHFNVSDTQGGAIQVKQGGLLEMETPSFIDNKAAIGGAIYNEGTVTVRGGSFSGNQADTGGAIFSVGSLGVYNADFVGNQAVTTGGAIYGSGNEVSVWTSTFTANTCDGKGGAVFVVTQEGSPLYLDISSNMFYLNQAEKGGALFLSGQMSPGYLEFNTWRENICVKRGPAVYQTSDSGVSVTGNTACGNHGGLYDCDGIESPNKCVKFQNECVMPTKSPTLSPTFMPSTSPPSFSPTLSKAPSQAPSTSSRPSLRPSSFPSLSPSDMPSDMPSLVPSDVPSSVPTLLVLLSSFPSDVPSDVPSSVPTIVKTTIPTRSSPPSPSPTKSQTPSALPTIIPTSRV